MTLFSILQEIRGPGLTTAEKREVHAKNPKHMMRKKYLQRHLWFTCCLLTIGTLCCLIYNQRQSLSENVPLTFVATARTPSYQTKTHHRYTKTTSHSWENKETRSIEEIIYIDAENERELKRRLPNALVIGIRKGGTRAVLDFLSRHPGVKVCPREVHFFDRRENYVLGLEWYREQMPPSLPNQITIEKTPAYFVTDDAPELVFNMSSSIKLLVVVRDPTVRAISDYAQLLEKSNGTLRPFEDYVTENSQHRILRKSTPLITTGIYVDHLKRWLRYFPLEQIHFINGEELVKNPVNEMQIVENFLNLKPFIDDDLFYYNETKGFLCLVPANKKEKEGVHTGCLSESKGRPHPPVNDDVVTLLRDFYRPLNEEFYQVVGRSFGWP